MNIHTLRETPEPSFKIGPSKESTATQMLKALAEKLPLCKLIESDISRSIRMSFFLNGQPKHLMQTNDYSTAVKLITPSYKKYIKLMIEQNVNLILNDPKSFTATKKSGLTHLIKCGIVKTGPIDELNKIKLDNLYKLEFSHVLVQIEAIKKAWPEFEINYWYELGAAIANAKYNALGFENRVDPTAKKS